LHSKEIKSTITYCTLHAFKFAEQTTNYEKTINQNGKMPFKVDIVEV